MDKVVIEDYYHMTITEHGKVQVEQRNMNKSELYRQSHDHFEGMLSLCN